MRRSLLLGSSAVLMGMVGLVASFAPQEVLTALGGAAAGSGVLIVQLLGALYLGFAMVNWTAKGSPIGGIYGRPVALGNVMHFVVGALTLIKGTPPGSPVAWLPAIVYGVFAILFGLVLFGGSPARPVGEPHA